MILQCLRCHGDYDQPRRRATHFCTPCRADRKREADRNRVREVRAHMRDLVIDATLNAEDIPDERAQYLELMGAHSETMFARAGDYVDTLEAGALWPLVPDRQPVGTNSARGADDGVSTNYQDLKEWLDERARFVASGEWFTDNPHWSFALNDSIEASRYMKAA